MSLILNALKKSQQIKIERQQQKQSFGTSLPWHPSWHKRCFSPQKIFLILGTFMSLALFLALNKFGMHSPLSPPSQASIVHMTTLPISREPLEEVKVEFIEVPLEKVILTPVAEEKAHKKSIGISKKNLPPPKKKVPKKIETKSVEPIRENAQKKQVSIQPIPGQEAINHFNLGLIYYKNNQLYKALSEYKKALQIDPLNFQVHNNIGMVYKDLGRLTEAITHYQKALSISPTYEKAHHNLGVAYYFKDDFEKAILEFKQAIDYDPMNPETYNNLGLIYRKLKDLYGAKKTFRKGLTINPDYAPTHYNLAITLEDDGDWKNAALHYGKFIELAPVLQKELVKKVKRHLRVLLAFYEKQ